MKRSFIIIILCSLFISSPASSDDHSYMKKWYMKSSGQLLFKSYSGSSQLENLTSFGIFLTGDYLERGGFTVGYSFDTLNYMPGLGSGRRNTYENVLFLSGKSNFYPDLLPGKITLRLDSYLGREKTYSRINTPTPGPMGGGTSRQTITVDDKFQAVNPMVSFLNNSKTFYADMGYAYSRYRSDDNSTDDIDVYQWTPTLGFGFNRTYDWLQFRAYLINLSSSNRIGDQESTSALETKWTHWFSADAPLNLHSVRLSLLAGERVYTIDSDAGSLHNVADLQADSVSIGAEWKLSEQTDLLLQSGYEAYKNVMLNDRYSSVYMYIYLSSRW